MLTAERVYACECLREYTLEEALEMATVVFLGRATGNVWPDEDALGKAIVEFEVLRVWKGDPSLRLRHVETSPTSCGVNFFWDDDYLIFATRPSDTRPGFEEQRVYTHFCMGTGQVSRVESRLAELEAGYAWEVPPERAEGIQPVLWWAIGLAAAGVLLVAALLATRRRRSALP